MLRTGDRKFPSFPLWLRAALFALAYCACAQVGSLLTIEKASYIIFWLPAGLYVATLLLSGRREWFMLAASAFIANFAFDLFHGLKPHVSLFFCTANAAQALSGAWLVRKFAGEPFSLVTIKHYLYLAAFAAALSAALAALIGTVSLLNFGLSNSFTSSFPVLWASSAMTVLTFSPFIVAWCSKTETPRGPFGLKRSIEAAFLFCGLVLVVWNTIGIHGIVSPNKSRCVPFLLWAGLRFGVRGATLAQVILALTATFLTTHFGKGLSAEDISTGRYVLTLQTFVVITSLAGVIPALVMAERDRTTTRLRESEERFRQLTQAAFEGIAISENGRLVDVNDQFLNMIGCQRHEVIGKEVLDFISPESREMVAEALQSKREFLSGHRVMRKDGSVFLAEARSKIVTTDGRELRMTALRDITERKEAEHLIQTQRDVLEMITLGKSLQETLDTLMLRIESETPNMVCSILLVDEDGRHVRHGAAPSLSAEYLKALDGAEVGPRAGSCGTAVSRREPVFVSDIEHDPLWTNYRDLALAQGLRACWSTPVFDAQRKVLGVFAIYYRQTGLPTRHHLQMIEMATHTAAICILKHRTDEALRKSQEKFSKAFRCSPDAMALVELETGVLIEVNEGLERLFGFSRGEIIGRTSLELGFYRKPSDRGRVVAMMRENGRIRDLMLSGTHRDGHEIIVLYNSELIELDGRACMLTVLHDITERVQAENALRKSEEKFSTAFRTSPAAVSITELATGRFVDVNDAFCNCYGVSREEVIGRTSTELGIVNDAERQAEFLRHYGALRDLELQTKTRDGRTITVLLNAECLELNGRTCIIAAGHDITERKRAEADRLRARENFTRELLASQEAERKRIAGELHDSLGQNLLLIKNRVQQLLASATAEFRTQLESVSQLTSESIAEVRNISQDLRPYQLDQLGLTRALEVMLTNTAQSTGLVLERRLENADDVLEGDSATNVYRIVQECLNNIVKHAEAKHVRVELERDLHQVRLWIKDDGRGFFLNRSGGQDFGSNGLGLRNIAERTRILGGALKLHSAPRQGTSVEVIVPIAA